MSDSNRETLGFQAEVRALLHLMIHSLYSHREIFLRELISNASDANDKLRFLALSRPELLAGGGELGIWIEPDAAAGTLTVRDNGIGMTRAEAIAHLGTIARSGTAEFLGSLSGDAQRDAQLIGQFGVGFYSAFIVADRVEVYTRAAGADSGAGVHWASSADGSFEVASVELAERGTRVVLHLKEDAREFADALRLRALVRRYSDHIAFPVHLPKEGATLDTEIVNQAQALWTRPRTEIKDEEYCDFYRHIAHDGAEPLAWSHHRVEGRREYTSLMYLPSRAPFDLWRPDAARGLKLYVRRVFIMDDAEQFLPRYLRFVRGVIDAADLPLNVSRELLQTDAQVEAMRGALTRRALEMITRLADSEPDKYRGFWREFGAVLREGVGEDPANRERLLPLLRFVSTAVDGDEAGVSLVDYVARMQPGQEHIYYVVADSLAAARGSPHLERLRAAGVEVLLLADRVDEWATALVREFQGKPLKDAARGEYQPLPGAAADVRSDEQRRTDKSLCRRIKEALGDAVTEVRPSQRLQDSPACLVRPEGAPSAQLRRMLEAHGQHWPASKPLLEINTAHALLDHLDRETDAAAFAEFARVLYEQALLTEEGALPDPGGFARRLSALLARLAGATR
ncbi:MAG: molecular chaperone HtpG [Gammaproteobacteria bacterium]|nr:molecular chaperone HtpG [Gammaproteobacteria bacterium]